MSSYADCPAAQTLRATGIPFDEACYPVNADAAQAAAAMGLADNAVFKTLALATMNRAGIVLACLPAPATLDIKALAAALEAPRTALINAQALKRMTGFAPGEVTPIPLADRRRYTVYIDRDVNTHQKIRCRFRPPSR